MSGFAQRWRSRFGGEARTGVTVPPRDGALKPNRLLDEAQIVVEGVRPDNLARNGSKLLFSTGPILRALEIDAIDSKPIEVERFDSEITALASDGAGGYAVGLDNGDILLRGAIQNFGSIKPAAPIGPTALAFGAEGQLYACSGSSTSRPSAWKRDLVERNASGAVWRFEPSSGRSVLLAQGLAFPYGIAPIGDDALLVSESWRHRLLLLDARQPSDGERRIALDDLPGYPARIAASSDGHWLTIFASRGQLIEFVLREDEYRTRMMATIDPEFWMAPTLSSGRSFLEPLQLGGIRTMGALKAWAPTRSYGLLVHLDNRYRPTGSAHSRADGVRHGVTSCLQWGERVLAASKGGDLILSIGAEKFARG
jgi:sugar lactone lactonase YvrE